MGMANNPAGTKLGAASRGQNPNLKTGVIHGGRSLPSACFAAGYDIFCKVPKPNREQSMADYSPSRHLELTRRQAVAALAAGFAVAVRPISVETI